MTIEANKRLKKIHQQLKKISSPVALILETAPERFTSTTQDYYLADKNFSYCTESEINPALLLISNQHEKIHLITEEKTDFHRVWEGNSIKPQTLAKNLNLKLVIRKKADFSKTVCELIKKHEEVYLPQLTLPYTKEVLGFLSELSSGLKYHYPTTIRSSEKYLANLRLIKSSFEVKQIKKAIGITHQALNEIKKEIRPGQTEKQLAARLEYEFKSAGASGYGFPSIVASGKNASILHYTDYNSTLSKQDVVLIDCGAVYEGYNADITRCYFVDENRANVYQEIYSIVLSAQAAAISKVKTNAKISTVYQAAVKEITIGLKDLGVLKGRISTLIEKKACAPYFMHSIGHSLGLDVHDPSPHRGGSNQPLLKNMVFTIEPGLYFQEKTGRIPAGGIRIEDDVLVKDNGCQVLSERIEK